MFKSINKISHRLLASPKADLIEVRSYSLMSAEQVTSANVLVGCFKKFEPASASDEARHLLYVKEGRIVHVAYAEDNTRIFGPSEALSDVEYEEWWTAHLAWRDCHVAAARCFPRSSDALTFLSAATRSESAPNHYLSLHPVPLGGAECCSESVAPSLSSNDTIEAGEEPRRVRLFCPACHGTNVVRDAYATWSFEQQDWVLAATFDYLVCGDCGDEPHELDEAEEPFQCTRISNWAGRS